MVLKLNFEDFENVVTGFDPLGGGQSAKMKNGFLTNRTNCFELMRSTGMKNRVI